MRRVLTAVAMVTLVACGTRTPTRVSSASSEVPTTTTTEAPTTTSTSTSTSTSTTSTTAPRPRSTNGIQPGMLEAITSCEPNLKGAVLDVAAVNGPYGAAILHKADTVYRRSLTSAGGRWYDGEHGQAKCAPRVDDAAGSGPPNGWTTGEYAVYFDIDNDTRQGSTTDGTVGPGAVSLFVAISDSTVTKASMGGGYWLVLVIGAREPGVYCGYDANGRLVISDPGGSLDQNGMPGYTGPTEPPLAPTECPKHAPAVS